MERSKTRLPKYNIEKRRLTIIQHIERFILLFIVSVILLGGCTGCEEARMVQQVIGIEPSDDYQDQSQFGPVKANSREPVELPPFPEPSFAALIERFKADVAANRGDPEVLSRKKQVIDNPESLWNYGTWGLSIVVPNTYDPEGRVPSSNLPKPDDVMFVPISKKGEPIVVWEDTQGEPLYYFIGQVFCITEEQQERIDAIPKVLPYDQRLRLRYAIMFEGINSFTAAKYLYSRGLGNNAIRLEYAERAIRDYPDSVEAMEIWARSHPEKERVPALKEMLAKFPNYARGHHLIAINYVFHSIDRPDLAIEHMQKAIRLDSRIEGHVLGEAYYKIGEWEKAIAVFQGVTEMTYFQEENLQQAQRMYREQRN